VISIENISISPDPPRPGEPVSVFVSGRAKRIIDVRPSPVPSSVSLTKACGLDIVAGGRVFCGDEVWQQCAQ